MIGLAVPCAANLLMWFTLFANPRLGSRDDLTAHFVTGFLVGIACAGAGIIASFVVAKSPIVWRFRCYFALVLLLNAYGFLWSVGAVVNAFS
jgi:hypothetical protein